MFKDKIQQLQILSWILTNCIWIFGYHELSTYLIVPTLILTAINLFRDRKALEQNLILTSWILMSISWLLREVYEWTQLPALIFLGMGILFSFLSMRSCLRTKYKKQQFLKNGKVC
jgi:uncharacterized membrane protein